MLLGPALNESSNKIETATICLYLQENNHIHS